MSSELAVTNKDALIKILQSGKIDELVESLSQEVEKSPTRKSAEARRDDLRKLAAAGDVDFLNRIEDTMASYVRHVILTANRDLPVEMTQEDIDDMAAEYLDYENLIDFLKSRQELMKERVFAHLDDQFSKAAQKRVLERPVEKMTGKLLSEENGLSFNRERGSRKDPTVEWSKLASQLSPEAYEAVCEVIDVPERHIPAERRLEPSQDKLMTALQDGLITLDQVKDSLISGSWNASAFVVRKVDKDA